MTGATPEGARAAPQPRRMIFILEIVASADALARVLCPFAVLQADLAYVELRRSGEGASVRVETEGLDDHRAQLLARRLAQSPIVRAVGLGWSCAEVRFERPALP